MQMNIIILRWQVEGTYLSLCLVIADQDAVTSVQWDDKAYDEDFIYHRLDLKQPTSATVCNYYGQLAVKGTQA